MPRFLHGFLHVFITNPISVRLVSTGSKRKRHLFVRSGYLAAITLTLLVSLLGLQDMSLREMARSGARAFEFVGYLQLGMICLLAPVFMAGAIAQEANPRTWDILLTTPLNALQIVLGNLLGRLFFIVAMLLSSLPLFAVTQYFGGVPSRSIFLSYLIASSSALLVGAIAITLSVSRQAGRRAVFLFYTTVVVYMAVTFSVDRAIGGGGLTTVLTPLNPFLAQQVLLDAENYHPYPASELIGHGWLYRAWMGSPVATFNWLCGIISLLLVLWSTTFLRIIGTKQGSTPWYRRLIRLGTRRARRDGAREVWKNPIAWREAAGKRNTMGAIVGRWGFAILGIGVALGVILTYHFSQWMSFDALRQTAMTVVSTEIGIIALTAINISATAISREREDGSLDILLTTPITPPSYISGKLRGIVSFLIPMMAVPIATVALLAGYALLGGLGVSKGVSESVAVGAGRVEVPIVLAEGALFLPLILVPFVAFCVMVGLNWSLKSKGTIGSVIAAVGVIAAVLSVVSLCAFQMGSKLDMVGPFFTGFSPVTTTLAIFYPEEAMREAMAQSVGSARMALAIGSVSGAIGYALVVAAIHRAMLGPEGRSFDRTVRKLAGTS